jgi:hypothetical protein
MLSLETVSPELLALTKKLMQDEKLQNFRLVGGTALALQLGHRKSIDIDLFHNKPFDAQSVRDHINSKYSTSESAYTTNSVTTKINNIKVDIIAHQYPWLKPAVITEGVRMASINDIAAMKILAIIKSGDRQKDFADLYILLQKIPLNEIIKAYSAKYPDPIPWIAQQSVRTFDRVNPGTEITLFDKKISWEKVKGRLK